MKKLRHSDLNTKSALAQQVLEYLGTQAPGKDAQATTERTKINDTRKLYDWRLKDTPSDHVPVSTANRDGAPRLRVSPLLSKNASMTLSQFREKWENFFKTPVAASAAVGLVPAAGYWILDKFLNPDDADANENIKDTAQELLNEDDKPKDDKYYYNKAIDKNKSRRWRNAGLWWLGSALLLNAGRINPNNWSRLWSYNLTKSASMLGPQMLVGRDQIGAAVALDDRMSNELKASAFNVLNYNPQPTYSSTDIVNNAIYSGESARTGLPMGRLISSAVVDAAAGYGLGKLLGIGSPKRLGALFGIGSGLINAISYSKNNSTPA